MYSDLCSHHADLVLVVSILDDEITAMVFKKTEQSFESFEAKVPLDFG